MLSRRKGHDFERHLVKLFKPIFPNYRVARGQQGMGGVVPDVDIPHFWIEAKRGRKPSPIAALKQAKRDTDGRIPVAIIRDDRSTAFVVCEYKVGLLEAETVQGRTIRMAFSDPCRYVYRGHELLMMSLPRFLKLLQSYHP